MSSKDIEKKFVGQPIFKQLIDFLSKNKFDIFAREHQTYRYYEAFSSYTQLLTMLLERKNPINHKIYRVLKLFVIKLVGDEGFEPPTPSV